MGWYLVVADQNARTAIPAPAQQTICCAGRPVVIELVHPLRHEAMTVHLHRLFRERPDGLPALLAAEAGSVVVDHNRVRDTDHAVPVCADREAKVGVLVIAGSERPVEAANLIVNAASHRESRTRPA